MEEGKSETHKPAVKIPVQQSQDPTERALHTWKQTTPLTKSDSDTRKKVQRKFAIQVSVSPFVGL